MGKFTFKISVVIAGAAGITLSVAVGYLLYRRHRSKLNEDSDEGIGDVDSIISDGEVEGENLSRNSSSTARLASGNNNAVESKGNDSCNDTPQNDVQTNDEFIDLQSDRQVLEPMKVLVLGLDSSGKTCLLNVLAHQPESNGYTPTNGFNTVQIDKEDIALSIMEVGGGLTTRSYWKNFTSETSLLVYLMDSADTKRFKEAKLALKDVLDNSELENVDLLFVANKQDLEHANKIEKIVSSKYLDEISKKGVSNITLYNTTCISQADGTNEGDVLMDIIVGLLKQRL